MNELEKNQAIYQAMCGIAQKYFTTVVEKNEKFQTFMAEKSSISLKELSKLPMWNLCKRCEGLDWIEETVTVETFSCTFAVIALFDKGLLDTFRKLAKVKSDYLFTYEEKVTNNFIGSFDITFDNPADAKSLTTYVGKDDVRTILNYVLVEANATTGDISFVACNGQILSAVTNNTASIPTAPATDDNVFQALFTNDDWKRICDHARKSKSAVRFEIYQRTEEQHQDTFFAVLGDTRIRSTVESCKYPNWHGVIPQNNDKHFAIHPSDVNAAQKFLKSFKFRDKYDKEHANIFVSFYRGSDIAYFDYFDIDYDIHKTASFRLKQPSDITIGACFKVSQLQKMKFTGFRLEDSRHSIVIDCEESDYLLVMPVIINDGESYVFNTEQREVITQLATVA